MMALAGIAFLIGTACAFTLRVLAFSVVAIIVMGLAAVLAMSGFDVGMGAGMAALTAVVATQFGYVAGIALRAVIAPFFAGRANERGAAAVTGFSRP
jgi:hypothetical protein